MSLVPRRQRDHRPRRAAAAPQQLPHRRAGRRVGEPRVRLAHPARCPTPSRRSSRPVGRAPAGARPAPAVTVRRRRAPTTTTRGADDLRERGGGRHRRQRRRRAARRLARWPTTVRRGEERGARPGPATSPCCCRPHVAGRARAGARPARRAPPGREQLARLRHARGAGPAHGGRAVDDPTDELARRHRAALAAVRLQRRGPVPLGSHGAAVGSPWRRCPPRTGAADDPVRDAMAYLAELHRATGVAVARASCSAALVREPPGARARHRGRPAPATCGGACAS